MTQNEAMHMSNEQAVQILKPMRDMMRDQHGCPISDAYFAIEKAIRVLTTISPDEARGVGEWISERDGSIVELDEDGYVTDSCHCSVCNEHLDGSEEYAVKGNYCPSCGARMKGVSEDG